MNIIADLPAHEVLRRQANAVLALAQPVVALDGSGYYGIPSTELDEVAVRLGLGRFSQMSKHPAMQTGRGAGRTTVALVASVAHVLHGKPTVFAAQYRNHVEPTLRRWSARLPAAGEVRLRSGADQPKMMIDSFRGLARETVIIWDHQAVESFKRAVGKRIAEMAALERSR